MNEKVKKAVKFVKDHKVGVISTTVGLVGFGLSVYGFNKLSNKREFVEIVNYKVKELGKLGEDLIREDPESYSPETILVWDRH